MNHHINYDNIIKSIKNESRECSKKIENKRKIRKQYKEEHSFAQHLIFSTDTYIKRRNWNKKYEKGYIYRSIECSSKLSIQSNSTITFSNKIYDKKILL